VEGGLQESVGAPRVALGAALKTHQTEDPEMRGYILDMVDQLSGLADLHGEHVLGAMLAEVLRRQRPIG
jgi:hypothetical protein